MHTNYDTRGMADLAARLMGLTECAVLEEVKDGEGIGRVGKLPHPMTLRGMWRTGESGIWHSKCQTVWRSGYTGKPGGDLPRGWKSTMPLALGFGCDVYITGDIDHHTGIDAVDQGMCIIDAGHYGVEHIFYGGCESISGKGADRCPYGLRGCEASICSYLKIL